MKRLVLCLLLAASLLLQSAPALAAIRPSNDTTGNAMVPESPPCHDTNKVQRHLAETENQDDISALLAWVQALTGTMYLTEEHVNEIKVGDTCLFIEDEKQSIPYRWRYLISDESLIQVSSDIAKDTSGMGVMPGGDSAYRKIDFTALAPGECVISLRYGRHGETDWDGDFSIEHIYHIVIVENADIAREQRTDADQQWEYVLEDGNATITDWVKAPKGDLVIPGELDGYTVTGVNIEGFYGDSYQKQITRLILPASVTYLNTELIENCALTSIVVEPGNCRYVSIDGALFDELFKTLVACPGAKSEYQIPEGTKSIGDSAFQARFDLTRVVIPDGVTSIGNYAFVWCKSLANLTLPNSVTNIGKGAFRACHSLTSLSIPDGVTSISEFTFWECSGLTSVTLPGSLQSVGNNAFQSSGLTAITIPDGVTSIGVATFTGCCDLISVTLPGSVTAIGASAFEGCNSLTLTVNRGSFAEQYAKENQIPYVLAAE